VAALVRASKGECLPPSRYQAHPVATRHGWREDLLCSSAANSVVLFRGADVAVCRIHHKAYARWGVDAEGNATLYWGWPSPNIEQLEGA
jgi:hypothetical protein